MSLDKIYYLKGYVRGLEASEKIDAQGVQWLSEALHEFEEVQEKYEKLVHKLTKLELDRLVTTIDSSASQEI